MNKEKIITKNKEKDEKEDYTNKEEKLNNMVNNNENGSSIKKMSMQIGINKNQKFKKDISDKNQHKKNKSMNIINTDISKIKTKDTLIKNNDTTLKETQMTNGNKNNFDFYQSLWKIFFEKEIKNDKDVESTKINENEIDKKAKRINLINNKIKMIYNLLNVHMKYLKEKVLLQKGKLYFFETIDFFMKKFLEIEKYIINCILLIKFFVYLGDPVSLIKANQTLNYLAKELLDYKPKGGLIVHSINIIMKKCLNLLKIRKYYRSINIPYEIIKKYLLILSALIKFSKLLNIPRLYHKFLDHYSQIFEFSLNFLTQQHWQEKIILKSNLLFNAGNLMIKNDLIKSAINLYEKIISDQNELKYKSFIYYSSYYNCSILYYVIGDMEKSETFLGNILNIISEFHSDIKNILLYSEKYLKTLKYFECQLLIFSAEFNMEKENYLKAIENLRNVINILESIYQKKRFNVIKIQEDKNINKTTIYKNRLKDDKKKTTGKKKVDKISYEFLLEIEYFENQGEKLSFNEKIKEIVGGLFEIILTLQKEKGIKLIERKPKLINNNKINEIKWKRHKSSPSINRKKGLIENNLSKSYDKIIIRNINLNDIYEKSKININPQENSTNIVKGTINDKSHNEKESKIFITEKNSNIILNYFKAEFAKKIKIINDNEDFNNFKYFIILLANLSLKQIEILNNTQNTDVPIESFYNLPIFFCSQFKNSLNQAQKNIFNKLNFLSLIRCKILENPDKKISLNNINFKIFQLMRISINLKLENYSDISNKIKNILKLQSDRNFIFNNKNDNSENNIDENKSFEISNKNVEFKYKNEIDFKKFKEEIINEVNLSKYLYSQEEIDNMILVVKSKYFFILLNELDLKDINEIKEDKTLLIEILNKEIKKLKEDKLKCEK